MSGNASNKPGKRFESIFRRSLAEFAERGGGNYIRFFDGGRWGYEQQPADFLSVWNENTFLWECKAHHMWRDGSERRWSFTAMQNQAPRLMEWERSAEHVKSIVVVNLYGDGRDECFAIPIRILWGLLRGETPHDKRSLSHEEFGRFGIQLKRSPEGNWDVYRAICAARAPRLYGIHETFAEGTCFWCEHCVTDDKCTQAFCLQSLDFIRTDWLHLTPKEIGCEG